MRSEIIPPIPGFQAASSPRRRAVEEPPVGATRASFYLHDGEEKVDGSSGALVLRVREQTTDGQQSSRFPVGAQTRALFSLSFPFLLAHPRAIPIFLSFRSLFGFRFIFYFPVARFTRSRHRTLRVLGQELVCWSRARLTRSANIDKEERTGYDRKRQQDQRLARSPGILGFWDSGILASWHRFLASANAADKRACWQTANDSTR